LGVFFFSSRRRHTRFSRDWSSDVCSSDLFMGAGWNFDNSYATLPDRLFTRLDPTPVAAPQMVVLNEGLARELGLDADALRTEERSEERRVGHEGRVGKARAARNRDVGGEQ